MSAGGPLLNGQPEDDITVQTQVGLADTPAGQKVAIMVTMLLGKDAALQVADVIKATAEKLSSTRLVIAQPGTTGAVAERP